MTRVSKLVRSLKAGSLAAVLVLSTLVTAAVTATAAPAPVVPVPSMGMSADALPTVQVNGVVWSQVVVGNTVYAAGSFSTARPAGAAPGTSTTTRNNMLAYDIRTGVLVPGFDPSFNAQVLSVTASPDGTRLYAAGDFTAVDGIARGRLVAINAATGQVDTTFNPPTINSRARAVIATSSAVYVGGGFAGLGNGLVRNNLAAFSAANGAALSWNPNADQSVWAIGITGDGQWVFAGGGFQNVGGRAVTSLAKISASTGAVDPSWDAAINNRGPDTGIHSLRVQGSYVYGTAWSFGSGANLEGSFKIPVATSTTEWVTQCPGDAYSAFMTNGVVFVAGHPHYCGAMGGGFPQYPQWRFQHSMAWTDQPGGEILNNPFGHPNWHGLANGPSMVSWLPDMTMGSYTGQYQAGWDVDGNSDYVVFGGEFPTVNGVGQQGLVRFARRGLAPNREGPRFPGGPFVPRLVPTSSSTLRVSWTGGYDRDDRDLTYRVIRDGATASPRFTTTAAASWWSLPALGFVDTGLAPGGTYRYQVVANDAWGNTVWGTSATVTMPTSSSAGTGYAQSVRANGARIYWPMNESSGSTLNDRAAGTGASSGIGVTDARADGVTWNQSGAIVGDPAAALVDSEGSRAYALGSETAPDTFTIQTWVRTSTTRGGRIFGFSDLQVGSSGKRDRHLYMDTLGRIHFGVRAQNNSTRNVTSTLPYNNGQWHMVTATMSSAGMRLYVDGALVGSRTDTTAGEAYLGYWRLGGDDLGGWPSTPVTRNFAGGVDEVAVYNSALSQTTIQSQYALRTGGGGGGGNQAPTASFTWGASGLTASFDGRGSSDPDGTIASWAWNFGDGTTGSGSTASRTYAAAGTYTVTLTVRDNAGATATTTRQVSVSTAAAGAFASDSFSRSVTGGWGQADTGGAWTLTTATSNFAVANGVGTMRLAASSGPSAYLLSTSARDVTASTSVRFDKPGTGGGIYTSLVVRRAGTSDYRAKLRATGTDTTLSLVRTVSGAETVLTSAVLPGVVVAAGDSLTVRLQASGTGTTTLRAKAWRTGTTEPTTWTTTTTDTTAGLQGNGAVGLYSYLSGSATNAPVTLSFDGFGATTP